MKYKCTDCGEVFNEEDSGIRKERVGEFWGSPAYMEYNVCPNCNSDCIERYNESEDDEREEPD